MNPRILSLANDSWEICLNGEKWLNMLNIPKIGFEGIDLAEVSLENRNKNTLKQFGWKIFLDPSKKGIGVWVEVLPYHRI